MEKFRLSEKTRKFDLIFQLDLTFTLSNVKSKWKIKSNFLRKPDLYDLEIKKEYLLYYANHHLSYGLETIAPTKSSQSTTVLLPSPWQFFSLWGSLKNYVKKKGGAGGPQTCIYLSTLMFNMLT